MIIKKKHWINKFKHWINKFKPGKHFRYLHLDGTLGNLETINLIEYYPYEFIIHATYGFYHLNKYNYNQFYFCDN